MAKIELEIIVVGAGIAGLAAAISLSRAGHNVTVLEKSEFKREAGFMITIGPSAVIVLDSFGFDYSRARAVDTNFVAIYDGLTLECEHHVDLRPYSEASRSARSFYRPDLHNELKRLCLLQSTSHKSPKLLLGMEVVSVDISKATVRVKDGTTFSGDLIIGADGERSLVKAAFNDEDNLRLSPYRVFRALVPTDSIVRDEKQKALLSLTTSTFAQFTKNRKTLSWFEGRDGILQDLECGYPVDSETEALAEVNPTKAKEKMLEKFKDYHPDIVAVLKKAERVSDWEISYNRPLSHLFKSKALLIGDASHSMFPTTGQGGSQSLEDVGALSVLLSSITHLSSLPHLLQLYSNVRKDRMEVVQGTSGVTFGTEEKFAKERPWHIINKAGIRSNEEHLEFLYNYNIFDESRKVLEQGVPDRARL